MRVLARGNSIAECEKARDRKAKGGWKAITGIVLDDSLASWGEISYVVVMEIEDNPNIKKRRWNNRFSS